MSARVVPSFARRAVAFGFAFGATAICLAAAPADATTTAAPLVPPLLQDLRSFGTMATVLHIAAHPDDENTQLLTYLARGRGYRTGYLSITRGDGGQNEIGPDFDEKLGVARTQELLAARRLDGARQFFTRAIDFGFSKTPEETLKFWDHKEVLGDVVRIIRSFRPDVIVSRFPIPPGSGGHGHHTASAILAVEAFKLAGDPTAYPEQLKQGLTPWQPKRIVWNGSRGPLRGPTFTMDIGGNDPVTGETFRELAVRSRRMHVTQGFANAAARGTGEETFMLLAGDPAEKDLLDGIDTTWTRVPGGAEIRPLVERAIAEFKPDHPAASVPALLVLREKLAVFPHDPVLDDKRAQLDRILCACLGLTVKTIAAQPEVVPGEPLRFSRSIMLTADFPVKLTATLVNGEAVPPPGDSELRPGVASIAELSVIRPGEPITQPYWLQEEPMAGLSRVADPSLIGRPENPPAFPVEYVFEIAGQKLVLADEPLFPMPGPKGERPRRVAVIPPVSLRFEFDVSLFTPGATKPVIIELTGARGDLSGTAQLELPPEWKITPGSQKFHLATAGEKVRCSFEVTAPATASSGYMTASAEVNGRRFSNQRIEINYAHIPFQLLQPPARARVLSFDFSTRGKNAGYLPGAGDDTVRALEQLGYRVQILSGADLTPEKLAKLDAVVIGVRAFNQRKDLAANLPGLFSYVEGGGTVIVQYNRPNGLVTPQLGPYRLSIEGPAPRLRVTDEQSPVTFLAPGHAALNVPNKITPADFEGWVQERGAYFPSTWDEAHYVPVLAMSDPGEAPLNGSLLIARHGKGYFVYTGLAFFRQLPAGVPGAYRLLANLLSLGQ